MVVVTALVVMVGDRDNGGCRSGGHRGVSDGRGSMIVIVSLSWGCCTYSGQGGSASGGCLTGGHDFCCRDCVASCRRGGGSRHGDGGCVGW